MFMYIGFCFFVKWYDYLRGLFNAKAILVEEQYLIHSLESGIVLM